MPKYEYSFKPHLPLVKMNVNQALCQSFTNQYILFVVGHHRWYGLCYVGVMRWSCQKLAAAEYIFPSSWCNYFMILGSCLLGIACRLQKRWYWTGLLKKEPSERLPMRPGGLQNVPWTAWICWTAWWNGCSWMQLGILPFVNFPYSQEFVGTWHINTMMCDISLRFPLDVSASYLDLLKVWSVLWKAQCLRPDDPVDE